MSFFGVKSSLGVSYFGKNEEISGGNGSDYFNICTDFDFDGAEDWILILDILILDSDLAANGKNRYVQRNSSTLKEKTISSEMIIDILEIKDQTSQISQIR